MKKIIGYSVILLFLVSSCQKQKDLPLPEVTEPHFYVKCAVDGQPLDIQAGNEEYYMNSSWFYLDSPAVYVYKGNLAKQTGAGYQVTILINDSKITHTNGSMSPDSALRKGSHLYYDQNTSGLTQEISFTPARSYVGNGETYNWTITDGVSMWNDSRYSPSHICEVGKTYSVTLNYDDNQGNCSSTLTNVFKAGSKLQTTITASKVADLSYKFSYAPLPPYSGGNFSCLWTFPDATTEIILTPTRTFGPGKSLINLKVKDDITNETCTSYYQLDATIGGAPPCDANYKANFLPIQNNRLYASVTILLTDPQGFVYTSQGLVQPASSNFEILSVEEYSANDKGEPTKRLTAKFNCIVKNGNKEINLTGGEAKIAVAYK